MHDKSDSGIPVRSPGYEGQSGNSRDARQRFTSESERTDVVKIRDAAYFAGSVPEKSSFSFFGRYPASVISDSYICFAASSDLNDDRRSPRVDRILHEFLDS